MSNRFRFLPGMLFFCCWLSCARPLQAQTPKLEPPKRVVCNCAELRFTLKPGGSQTFVLPAVQSPVRIEVSFTLANGGTQEPSELMYAVVNQDPSSKQLTWIGTSNDGSASGSNSLKTTVIANIFGGGAPTVNASLEVAAAAARTLVIKQNASTTALPGQFVVRLYF